jgi:MFS family permease
MRTKAGAGAPDGSGVGGVTGGTFRSLRIRNFRIFILGQIISTTGTWMQLVAQPWLVLQLTGSGVALGIDTALGFLPILLFGAWGGVLADRIDNRRLQLATQTGYAVISVVLFLLVWTGVVQLWMVYSMSFITGLVSAVDFPTRQSFYLEMVGPDDLTNAMSLNTATFTGTRIVGPVIAGVLIAAGDTTAPVFLINAVSYLAVVGALLLMRTSEFHLRERVARGKGQIRAGISYAWRTPALRLPLVLMLAVFLFAFNFSVLLPLLAVRSFKGTSETYGVILALFGIGSLAGSLTLASRASRPNPRRLAAFGVAMGALSIGLALAPVLPVVWVLLPLLGAAGIGFAITGNSTLQLTASSEMRGRVMSLYTVVFLGSTPIGGPIAGWIGEHIGPRFGLAAGGVVAIAASTIALAVLRPGAEATIDASDGRQAPTGSP